MEGGRWPATRGQAEHRDMALSNRDDLLFLLYFSWRELNISKCKIYMIFKLPLTCQSQGDIFELSEQIEEWQLHFNDLSGSPGGRWSGCFKASVKGGFWVGSVRGAAMTRIGTSSLQVLGMPDKECLWRQKTLCHGWGSKKKVTQTWWPWHQLLECWPGMARHSVLASAPHNPGMDIDNLQPQHLGSRSRKIRLRSLSTTYQGSRPAWAASDHISNR